MTDSDWADGIMHDIGTVDRDGTFTTGTDAFRDAIYQAELRGRTAGLREAYSDIYEYANGLLYFTSRLQTIEPMNGEVHAILKHIREAADKLEKTETPLAAQHKIK